MIRYAVQRPRAQGCREGIAERILGARHIACAGSEKGDEPAVAFTHHALGSTAGLVCLHQLFQPAFASTIGRISIEPYLLDGQRLAQVIASSRLGASRKK